MLDVIRSLKSLLKTSRIQIDNDVFRLHYAVTVTVLLAFTIVVSMKQFVGDPIDCIKSEEVPQSIINTYCWIHATFSLPSAYDKIVGKEIPYPGVDAGYLPSDLSSQELKYHKYYQWVCFMLFFQAALFYFPKWLWKLWEGGKIQALMMDLDIGLFAETEKKQKKKLLVDYLTCSSGQHDWYALKYFFCEALTFVNVVGQMFLMNLFFDGEFLTYGLDVIQFSEMEQSERLDPMIRVFPRVAKCRFFKFGASGNLESHDALCLLPLNIVNEKIYIFLWFWFIVLAILTGLVLIYRVVIIACQPVRVYLLNFRFRIVCPEDLKTVVKNGSIGNWFIIFMLGLNIDPVIFKEVIEELAKRVKTDRKDVA
ncbi:innexin shaking-B-like [Limulus polyphemus]|uniref:Innexin n=1 Tax=Limulus polyphemus TaxID=6850 RepID=A0ABM1RVY8_LIMPO|nr:innexin shaking-B-like [Limulus polyphemus]